MTAPGYRTRKSAEFAIRTNQPGDLAAAAALEKNWKTLNEEGFIIGRQPGHRGGQADRGGQDAAGGQPARVAADRLDGARV